MKKSLGAVAAVAALVLGQGLLGAPAAHASDLACGDTITADVVLTADLHCVGTALHVAVSAPDTVRIDLAGKSILGDGTGRAIEIDESTSLGSLVVAGGTIRRFESAIAGAGPAFVPILSTLRLESVVVRDVARWVTPSVTDDVQVNRSWFVDAGTGGATNLGGSITVRRSVFVRSGVTSLSESTSLLYDNVFVGGGFKNGPASTFVAERNSFRGCTVGIIGAADWPEQSLARDNVFLGCEVGMSVTGAGPLTVSGNTFLSNKRAGLSFTLTVGASDVLINGNLAVGNGDDGIAGQGTARVTLSRNTALSNGGNGIDVSGVTDGGGNRGRGNRTPPQCVGVNCPGR